MTVQGTSMGISYHKKQHLKYRLRERLFSECKASNFHKVTANINLCKFQKLTLLHSNSNSVQDLLCISGSGWTTFVNSAIEAVIRTCLRISAAHWSKSSFSRIFLLQLSWLHIWEKPYLILAQHAHAYTESSCPLAKATGFLNTNMMKFPVCRLKIYNVFSAWVPWLPGDRVSLVQPSTQHATDYIFPK